ncbi:MAG: hypothetical protein IJM15_03345, partial [Erysipelotrichaceae bacterium]|nr:hypothetical protein [Erysipelotrichaceae bacterium]
MSKKLLVAVLALALFFGITPMKNVKAISSEDLTVEAVQQFIPDPVFAQVIVDVISADASVNWGDYYNVKDLLQNYNGKIEYANTDTENMIHSIVGINYLENAIISLSYQDIKDLTPLAETSMMLDNTQRGQGVQINNSPVHIWPTEFLNTVSGTHAIPTPLYSLGKVVYAYGTEPQVLNIKYDVYQGSADNPTAIAENKASYYKVSGSAQLNDESKPAPLNGDTQATFKFVPTANGQAIARIQVPTYNYYSAEVDPQTLTPAYMYTVDAEIIYPVLLEVEASSVGSVYLVKYSTDDLDEEGQPVEGAKPLADAVYELYKRGTDEDEYMGTYVTEETPVLIENLEPGDYYFVEVQAPDLYKLDDTPLEFTIGEQGPISYSFEGLKQSVSVTPNNATLEPQWEALKGYETAEQKFTLKLSGSMDTVAASSYSTSTQKCVGLVGNGEDLNFAINSDAAATADMTTKSLTWYVNGTKVADKDAVITTIKQLAATNSITEPIVVKVVEEFEVAESARPTAVGKDTPITIWVENSTEDDLGGTVNVQGCEEDTISSSKVYENQPRENNNVVEGQADIANRWYVVVDEIKVGPMGPDGQSGATYVVVEQEQDEDGNYI